MERCVPTDAALTRIGPSSAPAEMGDSAIGIILPARFTIDQRFPLAGPTGRVPVPISDNAANAVPAWIELNKLSAGQYRELTSLFSQHAFELARIKARSDPDCRHLYNKLSTVIIDPSILYLGKQLARRPLRQSVGSVIASVCVPRPSITGVDRVITHPGISKRPRQRVRKNQVWKRRASSHSFLLVRNFNGHT